MNEAKKSNQISHSSCTFYQNDLKKAHKQQLRVLSPVIYTRLQFIQGHSVIVYLCDIQLESTDCFNLVVLKHLTMHSSSRCNQCQIYDSRTDLCSFKPLAPALVETKLEPVEPWKSKYSLQLGEDLI